MRKRAYNRFAICDLRFAACRLSFAVKISQQ